MRPALCCWARYTNTWLPYSRIGVSLWGGVVKDIMGVVNDIMGVVVYIVGVSWCPIESMIVTLLSSVLNAAIIMLLGNVYEHLDAILTHWGYSLVVS